MSKTHPKAAAAFERLRKWDETEALRKPRVDRLPKAKSGKQKQKEMPFQVRLVVALRRRLPKGSLVWHTPGRRSSRAEAIYFKQMGALAGMPDLFILVPWASNKNFNSHLFAVECKAKRGANPDKDLSDAQEYIQGELTALGVPYYVATDVEGALAWIGAYVPLKESK